MSIKTVSSRVVYSNPWCTVREDVIERDGGTRGIYGVMDKHPAVIIIPLERTTEGDFVWLVRQFRYAVKDTFFELPQGSWEECGVDPEELARGELAEETGLRVDTMTHISDQWIAYGAMHQLHHVYLAEGFTQGETDRDPEEHDMTVHRVRVSEFEAMMLDGRVMDNCTCAAWGVYRLWRERQ